MISRTTFAAILIAGTATGALAEMKLADVKVNTPGVTVQAPSGGVELDVGVNRGAADAAVMPTVDWVGRPLFSIDGKRLGEVAVVNGENIYADIGGFLGLGETRVKLGPNQIGSATDERVVIKLTEEEAKDLPKVDNDTMAK